MAWFESGVPVAVEPSIEIYETVGLIKTFLLLHSVYSVSRLNLATHPCREEFGAERRYGLANDSHLEADGLRRETFYCINTNFPFLGAVVLWQT